MLFSCMRYWSHLLVTLVKLMRPGIILASLKPRPSKEEDLGLRLAIGKKQLCGLPYILIIGLAVSFCSMNQAVLGIIDVIQNSLQWYIGVHISANTRSNQLCWGDSEMETASLVLPYFATWHTFGYNRRAQALRKLLVCHCYKWKKAFGLKNLAHDPVCSETEFNDLCTQTTLYYWQ